MGITKEEWDDIEYTIDVILESAFGEDNPNIDVARKDIKTVVLGVK